MAIILNDNIKINAGKPIDSRYLTTGNTAYISLPAVCAAIPIAERYIGLTVIVKTGSTYNEYWYRTGVTDSSLELKTRDIEIPTGDFITGGTNIGYFCGYNSIQKLCIASSLNSPTLPYDGFYCSVYNNYYRSSNAEICIGDPPSDGIPRRGYVKTELPNVKSWIWNERICGSESRGWIYVDGDVTTQLGTCPSVQTYYNGTTCFPILNTEFTVPVNSGGTGAIIFALFGTLSSGTTLSIGARPYAYADHNNLHFRTIISDTPSIINVSDDSTFIRISGATPIFTGANIGSGTGVVLRTPVTGTTLNFRTLRGSGDTIITTVGNEIVIYAGVSGQTSITGGTNIGFSGGTGIFAGNDNKTMQFRSIVGSGDTVVTQSGDTVVIFTDAGEQTYNLASPSVIPLGGICSGTVLTGKTAFELFEELLVPELCGSIIDPSISIGLTCSGTKEVGTVISQTVTGTFSRGSINPQYCSLSPYRSGVVNAYCFVGEDMPSGWQACVISPASQTDASYTVTAGTQTWGVCAQFDAGLPALGSKGTEYCAALDSGSTSLATATITGIYPYFYGVSTTVPTPGSALLTTGNKTLATSTGTLNITYGVQTAKYLWFATPAASTTKQGWYEGATNKGNIGSPSDLFDAPSTISVDSPDSCWTSISYKFYISNYSTSTSANVYCMTNAQQQ